LDKIHYLLGAMKMLLKCCLFSNGIAAMVQSLTPPK